MLRGFDTEVESLAESLNGRGYRAEALHGGMDQHQRDRVMNRLRSGAADLIVATDVAARGLDVEQLTHVVNYDVPSAPESYVHRIGRVGRGGREGVAITLAEPREHRQLKTIERVTKNKIAVQKVPTVADIDEMHRALRARLIDAYGEAGNGVRILYGGSVKASNAAEIFAVVDVDGALVGGASLTAADFLPIVEAAANAG